MHYGHAAMADAQQRKPGRRTLAAMLARPPGAADVATRRELTLNCIQQDLLDAIEVGLSEEALDHFLLATSRASGMFPLSGTMDLAPMRSDQDPQK